jgi:hypothetical protein
MDSEYMYMNVYNNVKSLGYFKEGNQAGRSVADAPGAAPAPAERFW